MFDQKTNKIIIFQKQQTVNKHENIAKLQSLS